MEKRNIKTKLIGKEELFKVLALSESMKSPVLLVGSPGVAKTQALLDYAKAMYSYNAEAIKDKCFIIELDESTKNSEIKGRPSMKELLENKKYVIDAPIAEAEYVLINEVDKGSSAVRNTMLSVMREKALFLGSEVRRCKWKLFAGSCNEINSDKSDAPFWDRFIIKFNVDRVPQSKIHTIWENVEKEFFVNIPNEEDINKLSLNQGKLKIFLKHIYSQISDRTATCIPSLVKAIKIVWDITENEAIIKCCEMLVPSAANGLSKLLEDPRIVEVKNKIQKISGITDIDFMQIHLSEIGSAIESMSQAPLDFDAGDISDLKSELKKAIKKSKVCEAIVEKQKKMLEEAAKSIAEISKEETVETKPSSEPYHIAVNQNVGNLQEEPKKEADAMPF